MIVTVDFYKTTMNILLDPRSSAETTVERTESTHLGGRQRELGRLHMPMSPSSRISLARIMLRTCPFK